MNLVEKHGITLHPVYIPTHFNVEADYLLQGWLVPKWHLLPCIGKAVFHLWGQPEVDLLALSHNNHG